MTNGNVNMRPETNRPRSKRTRVMFLDPITRQEIWVGLVSGEINPNDLDKNVNKSIAKMVQRFVRHQGGKK